MRIRLFRRLVIIGMLLVSFPGCVSSEKRAPRTRAPAATETPGERITETIVSSLRLVYFPFFLVADVATGPGNLEVVKYVYGDQPAGPALPESDDWRPRSVQAPRRK